MIMFFVFVFFFTRAMNLFAVRYLALVNCTNIQITGDSPPDQTIKRTVASFRTFIIDDTVMPKHRTCISNIRSNHLSQSFAI